jgi:hypothetical protein
MVDFRIEVYISMRARGHTTVEPRPGARNRLGWWLLAAI